MATAASFFQPVSLNSAKTPLGRGERPSALFTSIEKVEDYLQKHGPFTVLSSIGPHCYTLPAQQWKDLGYGYWPKDTPRIPNPSLRLMKVIGVATVEIMNSPVKVLRYHSMTTESKTYIASFRTFFDALAEQNPDYRRLLEIDVSSIPSYQDLSRTTEESLEHLDFETLLQMIVRNKNMIPESREGAELHAIG